MKSFSYRAGPGVWVALSEVFEWGPKKPCYLAVAELPFNSADCRAVSRGRWIRLASPRRGQWTACSRAAGRDVAWTVDGGSVRLASRRERDRGRGGRRSVGVEATREGEASPRRCRSEGEASTVDPSVEGSRPRERRTAAPIRRGETARGASDCPLEVCG